MLAAIKSILIKNCLRQETDKQVKMNILINHVFYSPVGHVVETIKFSYGLFKANQNVEIYVALNKSAPCCLLNGCYWITGYYEIDLYQILEGNVKQEVEKLPKEWDYIFNYVANITLDNAWESLCKYFDTCDKYLIAKRDKGKMSSFAIPSSLKYSIKSWARIHIPHEYETEINDWNIPKRSICVMLGGSSSPSACYPSIESWIKILRVLEHEYKDLKIYLTGMTSGAKGQTTTRWYNKEDINFLMKQIRNIKNCYNIKIWKQLALLKACSIFLSPHTGFGFLSSCVNTPWLTISGGNWPEYFFNGTSFYSVLPDNPEYPYVGGLDYNLDGKIPCMEPQKLESKIPEILEATKLLFDKNFTYEVALQRHRKNINNSICKKDRIPKKPSF